MGLGLSQGGVGREGGVPGSPGALTRGSNVEREGLGGPLTAWPVSLGGEDVHAAQGAKVRTLGRGESGSCPGTLGQH